MNVQRAARSLAANCEGFLAAKEEGTEGDMKRLLPQGVQQGLRGFKAKIAVYEPDIYEPSVRTALDSYDPAAVELVENATAVDFVGLADAVDSLGGWARRIHAAATRVLEA